MPLPGAQSHDHSYRDVVLNVKDPLPFLGFTMLRADLEVNLLSALRVRGDYDQCVALSLEMLALPPAEQGGVTALLFSFVDWTPSSRKHVNAFGHELTSRGELRLPAKKKLFDEVEPSSLRLGLWRSVCDPCCYLTIIFVNDERDAVIIMCLFVMMVIGEQALRVQNSEKKFLNVALHCVTSSPDARVQAVHQQAAAAISRIALLQPAAVPTASAGDGDGEGEGEGFVLITQFFFPPEDEEVRRNTQDVLVRNLQNPAIAQVFLVCDQDYDFSQLPQHHKITRVLLTTRLKFSDALRLASDRLAGRAVILANSDIYFDSSLGDFLARRPLPLEPDLLLALSTWTPLPASSSLQLSLRSDSQDAWLLAAPVSEEIIRQADFFFGIPRCDNRIAKIFMNSGYRCSRCLGLSLCRVLTRASVHLSGCLLSFCLFDCLSVVTEQSEEPRLLAARGGGGPAAAPRPALLQGGRGAWRGRGRACGGQQLELTGLAWSSSSSGCKL